MGLQEDLGELKKTWKRSSVWFKVLLIFSTFMTISSVASLSEVVFSWKGFILDGINFYRNSISLPLKDILKSITGIRLDSSFVDVVILTIIFMTTSLRYYWFVATKVLPVWKVIVIMCLVPVIFVIGFLSTAWYRIDWNSKKNVIYALESETIYLVLSVFLLFIIAQLVFFKPTKEEKFILFTPLIIAVVCVFLLGAINAGLSK